MDLITLLQGGSAGLLVAIASLITWQKSFKETYDKDIKIIHGRIDKYNNELDELRKDKVSSNMCNQKHNDTNRRFDEILDAIKDLKLDIKELTR